MYTINEDGINARQIVPEDFLFLSTADRQVVQAMGYLIYSLYGVNPDSNAIFLSTRQPYYVRGIVASQNNTGTLASIYHLPKGYILYGGILYETSDYSTSEVEPEDLRIVFEESVCSPSPVFGPGDNTQPSVSCHRKHTALVRPVSELTGGENTVLSLGDIKVLYKPTEEEPYKTALEAIHTRLFRNTDRS